MLSTIREKAKGWIAWIIVILISIPFALWGINSYLEALHKVVVAEVEGVEIDSAAFQRALDEDRQALRRATRGRVDPAVLEGREFKRRVLERLIQRILLRRDVETQGYRISDAQLRELIRSSKEFQREGRFAPELYQQALRRAGFDAAAFEEQLRTDNAIVQIRNGFVESVIVTKTERKRVLRLARQRRRIQYVQIMPERFEPKIKITPQAIQARYAAERDKYRLPEQVRVEYVQFSVGEIARQVSVTEAELRQAYEENIDEYTQPEERRSSHILVRVADGADAQAAEREALEKARTLAQQARAGADFAKLAAEHSADTGSAAKGGDLGWLAPGMTEGSFEEALFRLKSGEISDPIRTSFGYHVIKLTGIKPARREPFARVRARIERRLRRQKAEARFLDQAETFRDLVYEHPDSLQPVAETLGLKLRQSDWFGRRGGSDIAANPKVVAAAFSDEVLGARQNSDTIEVDVNTLVALRVVDHRPARPQPLEAVRAQIEQALRRAEARRRAVETGKAMLAALRGGQPFAQVAKKHGLKVRSPAPLARAGARELDRRLMAAVFRAPHPQGGKPVFGGVDLGDTGYAVFALHEVLEPPPDQAAEAQGAEWERLLRERQGSGYFGAYLRGLRARADVVVYADKL